MSNKYPLSGIKVLELARVLAGPWAGQILADLGADVIKVESPLGDETRRWGANKKDDLLTAYFKCTNRGKRSFVADLSNKSDIKIVKELACRADVIIENFKVGNLKKYDLDYEKVRQHNPKIIYCSITGFGQTGPYSTRLGYDFIIQAMGGIMDLTGESSGAPQKPGVAYADIFTGVYSVVAIQSAIIARYKSNQGTHIDMSLFDTQLGVLANQGATYLETGITPKRMGNAHPVIVPYQKFDTCDGSIIIACGNNTQFKNLCKALGWSFYKQRAYSTNENRVFNREKLVRLIEKNLIKHSKSELVNKLLKAGVPSGEINTVAEALTDPHAKSREIVLDLKSEKIIRSPISFNSLELNYTLPAPELGEHTKQIKTQITKPEFWRNPS